MKILVGLAIGLLLAAGFATAYPWWVDDGLAEIMDDGSYADLQEYRESVAYAIMPWVDSEKEFELMQEHHRQMTQWRTEAQWSRGAGGYGNCHRW